MPIYEYQCPKCGEFEVTQRITEDPLKRCPTCKSKVRKLISNTSFQLKGSGWYATDYAKKTTAKEAKEGGKDTGTSSAGEAGKGTGSESKPTSTETSAKGAAAESGSTKTAKKDTSAKAA